MNLIDFYVTQVTGEPYFSYGKWFLKVMAISHGRESECSLMFNTEQQAKKVDVGHRFLG
jgi:hypothetical protein